jgi:predicted DNA-binding transcriptional regulator AlpA
MTDLISAGEVAEILGVSARRVNALAAQRSDFPAPAHERPHAGGVTRLWDRAEVERWAQSAQRAPGRPAKSAT